MLIRWVLRTLIAALLVAVASNWFGTATDVGRLDGCGRPAIRVLFDAASTPLERACKEAAKDQVWTAVGWYLLPALVLVGARTGFVRRRARMVRADLAAPRQHSAFSVRSWQATLASAALSAFFGMAAVGFPIGGTWLEPTNWALVLLAMGAGIASIPAARMLLCFDAEEVLIRNQFRTHRLRWDQVARVDAGRTSVGISAFGYPILGVRFTTTDGKEIVAVASTLLPDAKRQSLVEALRAVGPRSDYDGLDRYVRVGSFDWGLAEWRASRRARKRT